MCMLNNYEVDLKSYALQQIFTFTKVNMYIHNGGATVVPIFFSNPSNAVGWFES